MSLDFLAVLLGLLLGSFLNVCIYRLPREQSVVSPASYCPGCKKPIRWFHNIPLLSYLLLRGRCRSCSGRISIRYPFVESLAALAVWGAYRWWGLTPYGLAACILFLSFIVVTFVDFDFQIIPDEISLSLIVGGVAFSWAFPVWHHVGSHSAGLLASVVGLLAGGGVLYAAGLLGELIFRKESMGGGDVKLLAGIGAFLGWKGVFLTLFMASLFGSGVGLGMKWIKGAERIPFGPYLVLGAIAYMLFGENMLAWYAHHVLKY